MDYVSGEDLLEISNVNIIGSNDIDVILNLYQPFMGFKATALYLTLSSCYYDNNNYLHKEIFDIMQITPGDFLTARKILEACGLLKTYLKKTEETKTKKYIYVIYVPKNPKEFFSDPFFKGLLSKYVDQNTLKKIIFRYQINDINLEKTENISAMFQDVFHIDLNDENFNVKLPFNFKGKQSIEIVSEFDFSQFFPYLKKIASISEDALSQQECYKIKRIATLFGLDTLTICDIVANLYDVDKPFGQRVDIELFKKHVIFQSRNIVQIKNKNQRKEFIRISGKTLLADNIKLMEVFSPREYLQKKQNGASLALVDLKLLDCLSEKMQLENSVINALLDYCLKMNKNRLSKNYVEKIAGSLKRENINTALDAVNYLNNISNNETKIKFNSKVNKNNKDSKRENYDKNEYDEVIKSIKIN